MSRITGAKVFSASRYRDREEIGDRITQWLLDNPSLVIVDKYVTQSSDSEFHCWTLVIFYGVRA